MVKYLIDDVDINSQYGITVLKPHGIYESPKLRHMKHVWPDKSGVDIDFNTVFYDEQDMILECIAIATTKAILATNMDAFNLMFAEKGLMVLSVRDTFRRAYLVYREDEIKGTLHKASNGNYAFKFTLKLKVSNPAAFVIYLNLSYLTYTLAYNGPKGWLFWGDGVKLFIDADGNYEHTYTSLGFKEIIIDIDGLTSENASEYEPGP